MKIKNKLIVYVLLGMMIFSSLKAVRANMNIQREEHVEAINSVIMNHGVSNPKIVISAKDFMSKKTKYTDAVILFKPGVKVSLEEVKIKAIYKQLNGLSVNLPEKMFNWLKNSGFVSAIDEIRTDDNNSNSSPYYSDTLDWGVDLMDAEKVWGDGEDATNIESGTYTGNGVKVGIIDSGIDSDHDAFAGLNVSGWNFYENNSNIEDSSEKGYHGTKCAGVIAAGDDNEGNIGVAPKVDLYALKTDPENTTQLLSAINWAIENDLDILSMSINCYNSLSLELALERAYRSGTILIAAAGNEGDPDHVSFPALYSSTIAIGSVKRKDGYYIRYADSNKGDGLELMGPGAYRDIYTTTGGNNYSSIFGETSSAAAHVSGVCALILEACRDKGYDITVGDIRYILRYTADTTEDRNGEDVFLDDYPYQGYDFDEHGFGLVNAWDAIDYTIDEFSDTDTDEDGLTDIAEEIYGTLYNDADTDGDGIPDGWEFKNWLNPKIDDADEDPDNDDLDNLGEFNADTDPFDRDCDDDGLTDYEEVVTHETDPRSNDTDDDSLTDYQEVNGFYITLLGRTVYSDPNDPDTDGDALTDDEEVWEEYTDPEMYDTDEDGISDFLEVNFNLNPRNPNDADDDPDNDGLTNYEELAIYHTDPFDDDTDNGGKKDGWEVDNGKNPLDPGDDNGGWVP
jgi:hypothetical protein